MEGKEDPVSVCQCSETPTIISHAFFLFISPISLPAIYPFPPCLSSSPPLSSLSFIVTMSDGNSSDPDSITNLLPPSLNLPAHLSAQKYFFVCTLTVAAWDTLVLSPRTWRLLKTPEWPLLKMIFFFLRVFMPVEFTIVGTLQPPYVSHGYSINPRPRVN